jgi:sugar phosphate permease
LSPPAGRSGAPAPLFYGWYVLAAAVIIELFGLGFGIFAITTVYPFIIDTFPSWSRTTVFAPTTIIIATVGALSPFIGGVLDRYPIRVLFALGISVQSLALYLFSQVDTPFTYFATSALLGLGMSTVTILPNQVLISRWFKSHLGLVNGILLGATALGSAVAPPLITRIIASSDWRSAFGWLSLLAFGPPMLATLLLVRDRPETMGLRAYETKGAAENASASEAQPAEARNCVAQARNPKDATLREALHSRTFWVLVAAVFVGGMPCYSYNKHILVHLKELGYSAVQAADYKGLFFLISACARVSFGWLCDHFDRRRMVLLHFTCIAAGYPLLMLVGKHPQLLLPCLLIVGIGYGGLLPTMPIMTVHYFGRENMGRILGIYKVAYDIAAASAPMFTAALYDHYGSYRVADLCNTGFAWMGVALVGFGLRRRRNHAAQGTARIASSPASDR